MGHIVGKKRSKLNILQHVTGAKIVVPSTNDPSPERDICIQGTLEQIRMAKQEIDVILARCNKTHQPEPDKMPPTVPSAPKHSDQLKTIKMVIPTAKADLFMGTASDTLRDMERSTKTFMRIEMDTVTHPGMTRCVLFISGREASVALARDRINALLLDTPYQHTTMNAYGSIPMDASVFSTTPVPLRGLQQVTEDYAMRNEAAGLIIGRAGENIKLLQEQTSARIRVHGKDNHPYRKVTITGTMPVVAYARQVIDQTMANAGHVQPLIPYHQAVPNGQAYYAGQYSQPVPGPSHTNSNTAQNTQLPDYSAAWAEYFRQVSLQQGYPV